jgi:hypothetical protein
MLKIYNCTVWMIDIGVHLRAFKAHALYGAIRQTTLPNLIIILLFSEYVKLAGWQLALPGCATHLKMPTSGTACACLKAVERGVSNMYVFLDLVGTVGKPAAFSPIDNLSL